MAGECGVAPERLTILFAPIRSLAGSVQVVARVVEVALHKAHELKFPLERIVDAAGAARRSARRIPISRPAWAAPTTPSSSAARCISSSQARRARRRRSRRELPSSTSRDYGAPFAEIFRRFNGDFYAIDPMLFSPARVAVTALETGATFHAGSIAADLLDASFA